jgi:uncharacterized protein
MVRVLVLGTLFWFAVTAALADETPRTTIAVAGEAELLLPPDYASIELGVVTQGATVAPALSENSERMTRVIAALKALGLQDKDIRTSTFLIQPKYEKQETRDYETDAFRSIVAYYVSNKITVTIRNLPAVARVIDEGVKAGANASGTVDFRVDKLTAHLDEARRAAIANARHKAEVLTEAAHVKLGRPLSITDNRADTQYNSRAEGSLVETVVVTGSRIPTPIEPGLVRITTQVTVVFAIS